MAVGQLSTVVHRIRGLFVGPEATGATDESLLEGYLSLRDEAAFEALVRRHGPMVLGVCRRILGNSHDAEDAFQATFLILVKKAASVRPRSMVGNWLYGVACRTALGARRAAARRRAREAAAPPRTQPGDVDRAGLRAVLDEELQRLPPWCRAVLVLSDLEGKTRKEVALHLGWPEGTVASRLARARARLAKRLARYGLAVSGGSAGLLLPEEAACVAPSLVVSTVKAASLLAAGQASAGAIPAPVAALAEGVLKAMLLNKLKVSLVFLAVIGVVGTGLCRVGYRAVAGDRPAPQVAQAGEKPAQEARPAQDKREQPGKENPGGPKVADKDQATQILEEIQKGFQAYKDQKKLPQKNQAAEILEMVLKGFRAYQRAKGGDKGKKGAEGGKRGTDEARSDLDKLQGTWRVVSSQVGGEKAPADELKRRKVTVRGNVLTYEFGNERNERREGTIKLDPKTKALDWAATAPEAGPAALAIYDLKGEDLKIGFGNDGLVRPRRWAIGKDDVAWLLVLKRDGP